MSGSAKPRVLHIGDPVEHNHELYNRLATEFDFVRPATDEREREPFMKALKEKKWGDFHAIFRPFWNNGGEMGQWDHELISLLPSSVKVFASAGAGYNWADVDVLADHGILYCNGAAASSEAVADMAIYHIISVFRNLQWSQLAARSCDPDQFLEAHKFATMTACNPRDKILGIVGLGNIGYTIAKKAYACFGMQIHYQDLYRKTPEQESAVGATFHQSLDEMLGVADCIVLAAPFSGETLINAAKLSRFKRGSRLVNIARGGLIDEDALVAALEDGHLFAAGLDVHANEPHVHPRLAGMRQVNVTSHNAGGAIDTRIGFERLAMENIERVLTGKDAITPVNKHLLKVN
ncbi:hypothetical protein BAUCODRAFT_106051 [Baudoinia panamericana UAMH 10762]|uniref:D-isomer specific 2-hydroxyacid dehydrogenase NAD-binding domain-containing protein n=1 Tax=Baudoinia panamericana (strain UAMH 10762) TaxID=717646 RepID=M2LR40_BAUPA|nr:uncharacterized protein BAUCODRAFT_106051 [Baudoinia panamericana UAMH 10762]EMC96902.1 hypothetical protein BAUCODRAFT_106051 [Baudoinia panamericana UAMH 10762]